MSEEAKKATKATPTPEPSPAKEEMMSVSKDQLSKLIETVENIQSELKDKDEKIKHLEQAADKGRLDRVRQQEGKPLISIVNINMWEDEPIVGWKMTKDDVGYRNGVLVANQELSIFTLNDEDKPQLKAEKVDLLYFNQTQRKAKAEILSKILEDNKTLFKVKMEDGRTFIIDSTFVN